MELKEIKNILDDIEKDIEVIQDEKTASIQRTLLNLVEYLVAQNEKQQKEIQALKDEINHLKGEQGKPRFGGKKPNRDISSNKHRKHKKNKKPKKKAKTIKVDREMVCEVDKSELPNDALFKGFQEILVQDIVVKTDNINFKKEVYYSPSLKKVFVGKVPNGYEGKFGPGVKSHILNLSHDSLITQPAVKRLLETFGVYISAGTISRMITDNIDEFHKEKKDVVAAGLESTTYQHIDDTGCKVNGKSYYTHILCNALYTAYFTTPRKNRLTVLNILCQGNIRFHLNEETHNLMGALGLPDKYLDQIKIFGMRIYSKKELNKLIRQIFPNPKKNKRHKQLIIEACAIAGMHNKKQNIETLICDDAPQFKTLFDIALCWIHEGRHYKKLNPIIRRHRKKLDGFLSRFWDYYEMLLDYKIAPTVFDAQKMDAEFDSLFSSKTGYQQLDDRIGSSLENKHSLLLVLKYPELPLHNNPAELGARAQKRKGDVSLQTKNVKGTNAKDTFMTIIQTARKLGVNTYDYIFDRITKKFEMPSLAEVITQQAAI